MRLNVKSRRVQIAAVGTTAAVVAGVGIGYAFVINNNHNEANVTLANQSELPYVVNIDDGTPHLQPGASETIYVWVVNPSNQSVQVNAIHGAKSPLVGSSPDPATTTGASSDYCPPGSVVVHDATPTSPATTLTSVADGNVTTPPTPPANPANSNAPFVDAGPGVDTIPAGGAAIFAMSATFDTASFPVSTPSVDPSMDPNNQTGCTTPAFGGNLDELIQIGNLDYTPVS